MPKVMGDLTTFLLEILRKRPAMFLGTNQISKLPSLIFGYSLGYEAGRSGKGKEDPYFKDGGFLKWYFDQYPDRFSSFWTDSFLSEANGDEYRALEVYFGYLETFREEIVKGRESGVAD